MSLYRGTTADGSDMTEMAGLYLSPCGRYWSNEPFTRHDKCMFKIEKHLERTGRKPNEEYNLIMLGKSTLNSECKKLFLKNYKLV